MITIWHRIHNRVNKPKIRINRHPCLKKVALFARQLVSTYLRYSGKTITELAVTAATNGWLSAVATVAYLQANKQARKLLTHLTISVRVATKNSEVSPTTLGSCFMSPKSLNNASNRISRRSTMQQRQLSKIIAVLFLICSRTSRKVSLNLF